MKKTHEIQLINTSEPASIGDLYIRNEPTSSFIKNIPILTTRHLVITSDEQIEIGDYIKWYIKPLNGEWVSKVTKDIYDEYQINFLTNQGSKVIAYSDKSFNLPDIPKHYIEYFMKEYNKGNVLKEVDLKLSFSFAKKLMGQIEPPINPSPSIENNKIIPIIEQHFDRGNLLPDVDIDIEVKDVENDTKNTTELNSLLKKAKEYSNIKGDAEDEQYYTRHGCDLYDAFIAGAAHQLKIDSIPFNKLVLLNKEREITLKKSMAQTDKIMSIVNDVYTEGEVQELLVKATARTYNTIQDVRNWFKQNKKK